MAVSTKSKLEKEVATLRAQLEEYKTLNGKTQVQNEKMQNALALSEQRTLQEKQQQPRSIIGKSNETRAATQNPSSNKPAAPTRPLSSRLLADDPESFEHLDDGEDIAQSPILDRVMASERLRDVHDEDSDGDAATPDVISMKSQAASTTQARVGQKSNFSITPFLNKTGNMYESLDSESEEDYSARGPVTKRPAHAFEESPVNDKQRNRGSLQRTIPSTKAAQMNRQKDILGATPLSDTNKQPQSQLTRKRGGVELVELESQIRRLPVAVEQSMDNGAKPIGTAALENKKRKRMVFGAGLRVGDHDDDEHSRQDSRQSMKRMPKQSLALANALSAEGNSFSPLKRDRRGRSTSFLM